jgi:hypothetical protein
MAQYSPEGAVQVSSEEAVQVSSEGAVQVSFPSVVELPALEQQVVDQITDDCFRKDES